MDQFTSVPFTQYLMSGFPKQKQKQKQKTKKRRHAKSKKNWGEAAASINQTQISDTSEMLEFSDEDLK